jgi:hypothetical protein
VNYYLFFPAKCQINIFLNAYLLNKWIFFWTCLQLQQQDLVDAVQWILLSEKNKKKYMPHNIPAC